MDEGCKRVVSNIAELANAEVIYPAANYIAERQPYPRGSLPHNPRRRVYFTHGGLYFEPEIDCYKDTKLRPARSQEEGLSEFDVVKSVIDEASRAGLRVIPWIIALNDPLLTSMNPSYTMIDYKGRRIANWFCPSNKEVQKFVVSLVEDLLTNHEVDGILLDRIRFPEWSGPGLGFGGALTCFCESCFERAKTSGIDLRRIQNYIKKMVAHLGETLQTFHAAQRGALDISKFFVRQPELAEWIRVRWETIGELVKEVHTAVRNSKPSAELSLDLWPPSYSWLLGQDYAALASNCESMKYFTYYKLGGGVDISSVLSELSPLWPNVSNEDLLDVFYQTFGFCGPSSLKELGRVGLSSSFISNETMKAIEEVNHKVRVFAGIQIWDVGREDVKRQIRKAIRAGADGFIHFCYDWAPLENLKQIGETMSHELSR